MTRLQGKYKTVTILSACLPCKPSSAGVKLVYEQHAYTLPIQYEPINQFLTNLKKYTQENQEHGDLIIIEIDHNDPVQQYDNITFLRN